MRWVGIASLALGIGNEMPTSWQARPHVAIILVAMAEILAYGLW